MVLLEVQSYKVQAMIDDVARFYDLAEHTRDFSRGRLKKRILARNPYRRRLLCLTNTLGLLGRLIIQGVGLTD